jgi:hypothetical protein
MIIKDSKPFIEMYKGLGKDFKVRESRNYCEIVTSTNHRIYHNKNNKFGGGLYLFKMVNNDVNKYLEEYGEVEPYDELPVNFSNQDYDYEKKIVGIDINNAYWSVAHLKGYISDKTYKKGIAKDDLKQIRLSTLSSLGKVRVYQVFTNGVYSHDEALNGDLRLQNVYLDIRYSTYAVMLEIARELKDDFCCWKTDCIFFHDTENNRTIATEIIESYGLDWKVENKNVSKLKPLKIKG